MGNAVNDLLNAILNGGVLGSCGALCQEAITDPSLQVICDLLCDYVGIEEFINLVNSTDPDPIWLCQEMDACPIVLGGKVVINSADVDPASGAEGATFNISMVYTVTNATGPGGLTILILPASDFDFPMSDFEFEEGQTPGTYEITWTLQAEPSENESFSSGVYQVEVAVCAGDCTGIHSWSGVYAQANTKFTITNSTVPAIRG